MDRIDWFAKGVTEESKLPLRYSKSLIFALLEAAVAVATAT